MSRRQSVDRQGILSPPGLFLTPSPSPTVPASPRLQPSPSQSPFSHDVLLVTNNTITNTTQEQERKAATPGRRPSLHQVSSGSPNAGTVVFQPSPSQSPAAAQTIVGITGNEFNTTLVGSNNISLNKKSGKRAQQSYVNYNHGTAIATSLPLTAANMANSPKGTTKKAGTILQSPMANPSSSPVTNESPIASPSGSLKPPTPQPMLQSMPVMNAGNHLLQFIGGSQLITAPATTNQQRSQQVSLSPAPQMQSITSGQMVASSGKNSRGHQQILPKPQQSSSILTADKTSLSQTKTVTVQQQTNQISQSAQSQSVVTSSGNQQQGGQILLPTGNLNTQPLLLNQMPVIVQQNTPQGVQLILRPPTPQLTAPSLVIHNSRPQLQQPQPQQLLRILNTNGTMQLAAAPTFIVSSQANLIQQNLQTIKANTQTTPITQLSGLQTTPRSNIAAAFNSHIIGQSVAQLQNLQLNGNLAQIQMPNGLNGPIISQLPAQFQHLPAGFNQLNLNQLNSTNLQQQIAAAAAAAGAAAAFQSPPPPQVNEIQMPSVVSAQNIQFSTNGGSIAQPVNITSPAVTPQPQIIQSVTPEPVRHPTPTLQNVISHQGTTTVLVQPDSAMTSQGNAGLQIKSALSKKTMNENVSGDSLTTTAKPVKKPKPRKKKSQTTSITTTQTTTTSTPCTITPIISSCTPSRGNKKDNKQNVHHNMQTHLNPSSQLNGRQETQQNAVTSSGRLDLANVMKLCGIMEDDDYMDTEAEPLFAQPNEEQSKSVVSQQAQINIDHQQNIGIVPNSVSNSDIMITIPSQNNDMPLTFTIPTSHCDTVGQIKPLVSFAGHGAETGSSGNHTDHKSNPGIDSQNIVIKIDQLDNVPPYTITIPREEIQQSIQLAQQQSQQNISNYSIQTQHVQPQQLSRSVSVTVSGANFTIPSASSSSTTSVMANSNPTFTNSHVTLQSQINEIQNQLIGVSSTSTAVSSAMQMTTQSLVQMNPNLTVQQPTATSQVLTTVPASASTTTTAAIKPRRKPAAKRNGKKVDTIPTSVGNVPSQIGNIQISQIDATKVNANQSMPISNVVENKIQIMPIIDTTKAAQSQNSQQQPTIQLQQTNQIPPSGTHQQQFVPHSHIQTLHSEQNKVNIDNRSIHISAQPSSTTGNIALPLLSHQNSSTATIFPQLTGSLSLTFEEDGGRFILRHDPNLPQDPQSQIILQAILSGALCNVTVVNEPLDKSKSLKNNVTLNSANFAITNNNASAQLQLQQNSVSKNSTFSTMQNHKNPTLVHQSSLPQPSVPATQPVISNSLPAQSSFLNEGQKRVQENKKPDAPAPPINSSSSMLVNPTSPKLVALPKVDANQQLFTLNTITNQITHISPHQTTAALGPMERLLIVPLGINAQQLAECLSQGQIHFNNIGQATQASESHTQPQSQTHQQHQNISASASQSVPQIQQQIVRPQQHQALQPLQQNPPAKQVANVAPIIDASKAKAEAKPKKAAKPRKPKACHENISKAVKPIKKLDLNTKPSANPVQIVPPNTATKDLQQAQQQAAQHLMRTTPVSNVTTSISNNIQPFQSSNQSGNKLVGVTAPMQQVSQPQRNVLNNNQANISSNNMIGNNNNMMNVGSTVNNQQTLPSTGISSQINLAGINSTSIHLPSVTVTPKSQPEITQAMPPLISVNATPPVPRVQTIQLTPQQQQLLKSVQTQIQQLSSRLQNKSLLANLNIPSDFNPNNPIYNKPLPQLNNIQGMNDNEIHAALQRLFIEQQKILASGKLIPTIPAASPHTFMATTSVSPVPQAAQSPSPSPTLGGNNQQTSFQSKAPTNSTASLHASTLLATTHLKNEGQPIPANVVQPNNHNSTLGSSCSNAGIQQRVHIYPMQHQVQIQQQTYLPQQQVHQQQLPAVLPHNQSDMHVQMQAHHVHSQAQQQLQKPEVQSVLPQARGSATRPLLQSVPAKQSPAMNFVQPHLQLSPPQPTPQTSVAPSLSQQQQINQQSGNHSSQQKSCQYAQSQIQQPVTQPPMPPLDNNHSSISAASVDVATTPAVPTSQPVTPVIVTVKTEEATEQEHAEVVESPAPVASPKPKIPRHYLFERQLKVDQEGCINPDYMTPFHSKEDAVKRLIRYHCTYQQDESIPSDEDEELGKIAVGFQEKFRMIANKYQYLLLQESMRLYSTSEMCLVNELLVTDAQTELKELRDDSSNAGSSATQNCTAYGNTLTSNNSTYSNSCKVIKREPEGGVQMVNSHQENSLDQDHHLDYQNQQRSFGSYHHPKSNQPQSISDHIDKLSGSIKTSSNMAIKSEIKSEPRDMMFEKCDGIKASNEIHKTLNSRSMITSAMSSGLNISPDDILNSNACMESSQAFACGDNKNFKSFTVKDEQDQNVYGNSSVDVSGNSSSFSSKSSGFVKRENENFDIESEITPSFIMKKIDCNTSSTSMNAQRNPEQDIASNAFSIDYFMNSNTQVTSYETSTSTSLHMNDHAEMKKKDEDDDDAKADQYDEWLCIQKELNFITEKKAESNISTNDQKLSEIFEASSNKTVENHLSDLFNSNSSAESTIDASNNSNTKEHHNISVASNLHLSEFFNPDSIASKSVETRLEAMFGSSPVIEKPEQDTVESRLEEIFNGSSPHNSVSQHFSMMSAPTQNKRQWDNSDEMISTSASSAANTHTYNKRSCIVNSYLEESHVTSNHPRWIIDQNQFDFINDSAATTSIDVSSGRSKRSWNGEITNSLEHLSSNKKMCFTSKVESDLEHDLLGLSAPESNDAISNEILRHNINQHTAIPDASSQIHHNMTHIHNSVMLQMQPSGTVHHMQQQQMHDHHSHHHHSHLQQIPGNSSLLSHSSSIFENTLNHAATNHNMSASSSNTSISSNFDEDINRHVQNAIDSILNLHSSENDSLNFSLEHSMGSFLADSPLDQPTHHNTSVGGAIIQSSTNNSHCNLSSMGKRRQISRMDDLEDCLISSAGMGNNADNSSLMVGSPTSVMSGTANNSGNGLTSTAIADFSCVTSIDDAVKSIMTS